MDPKQGDVTIISTASGTVRAIDRQQALERACHVAEIADSFKGRDTVVLDLSEITPIVDYFVITTGTSQRQMQSIAEEAGRAMKAEGHRPRGIEGRESSTWILQDYGDIVLHVFTPESRQVYDLEHLWADAPRIDWKTAASRLTG